MKKSIVLNIYLIIAGLLLSFIGGTTFFMPVDMKATAEIFIENNVNLLNEVRAYSALLLAIGLLSILGIFSKKLTYTSTLTSALLFLVLGIGRLSSILLDGTPADGLVKATLLEFVIGAAGIIFFVLYREKSID